MHHAAMPSTLLLPDHACPNCGGPIQMTVLGIYSDYEDASYSRCAVECWPCQVRVLVWMPIPPRRGQSR
jgi:hypothetical protein